jgi:uncharacterized protein
MRISWPGTESDVNWPHLLALVVAGLMAGAINTIVGSGSLVSIGALLSLGYAPVPAMVINTVGLLPGSLTGLYGYRKHLTAPPGLLAKACVLAATGSALGAVILLVLPPRAFSAAVPCCILTASMLVLLQPAIARRRAHVAPSEPTEPTEPAMVTVESHRPLVMAALGRPSAGGRASQTSPSNLTSPGDHDGPDVRDTTPQTDSPKPTSKSGRMGLFTALFLPAAIYGGFFSAGLAIIYLAVFGLAFPRQSIQRLNAWKMCAITSTNIAAALVLATASHLVWLPAVLLGGGTILGGWLGAQIGQRLPARVLRALIVIVGTASAARFL